MFPGLFLCLNLCYIWNVFGGKEWGGIHALLLHVHWLAPTPCSPLWPSAFSLLRCFPLPSGSLCCHSLWGFSYVPPGLYVKLLTPLASNLLGSLNLLSHAGHWFDSQSGHVCGLWVQSPVRAYAGGNLSMFLSHIDVSLLLFLLPFPSL